jgi:hypothetical protein
VEVARGGQISMLDLNVPGKDNVQVLRAPSHHFGNIAAARGDGRNNLSFIH